MTKLDEIEELALSNRSRQARKPAVDILIRAVRQLGEVKIAAENYAAFGYMEPQKDWRAPLGDALKSINPDVLELLPE